jgi:hypothetical protein
MGGRKMGGRQTVDRNHDRKREGQGENNGASPLFTTPARFPVRPFFEPLREFREESVVGGLCLGGIRALAQQCQHVLQIIGRLRQ